MSNVISLLGMGADPRQVAWGACMTPEDYFKFPACHPRMSLIKEGIEELLAAGADDEDIRELVKSLTQRVIWTTIESTEHGLQVSFGTKDDSGGRYSYSVTV